MRTLTQYQVNKFDWMIEEIAKDLDIPKEKAIKFAASLFTWMEESHRSARMDAEMYSRDHLGSTRYTTRSSQPDYSSEDTLTYVALAAALI